MRMVQLSLLGREEPGLVTDFSRCRRTVLDAHSFLDYLPGFVSGQATLFEHLLESMRWQALQRVMYERQVDVPRLTASIPDDGCGHPLIASAAARLGERYSLQLDSMTLALYRDGNDSVAWHSDHVREPAQSVVAIVSLGDPRRFMLRPKAGGQSIVQGFGHGDLLVMAGACQAGWQHGIPKVKHAHPRMSIMFRNRANST
jgi:alkylated DNA repair dioxygenase AlkB